MSRTVVTYKETEHPMEQVLDIPEGTTLVPTVEKVPSELAPSDEYDEKDKEVETQFQEVYDSAMTAFEQLTETVGQVEPKYRARNEEVAVQYLNTALAAAKEKSNIKQHKDKLVVAKGKVSAPKTVNNNLIVDDRNNILKALLGKE